MLDDAQKDLLLRLFADGAELGAAERAAFVARACPGDPAVQAELAELLQVEAAALAGFLAAPAVPPPTDGALDVPPGRRPQPVPEIEGYADFERLAEGGMGSVYRAWQLRPVRREVAIKLIRPGMDTENVLLRFEAERQALALMSHPYIAAVYDAGTDAIGRPFLVMEFVDGAPITDYCERERLPLDDRLRLFAKVCRAVDHAHRRGVLHRDLKPSNVLVVTSGGEAMPKVIDFGIAKALEGRLGEQSIHTLVGTVLGTPEYMAPEQIEGAVHDIDTRCDVYSLGVVLYELLTRARPIEASGMQTGSVVQFSKLVRDTVPPKPSTRLKQRWTTHGGEIGAAGDEARWWKRLEGDLDWVVMKALEKEPDRRYGSPRELAEDLENFLTSRPVTAGPPSGLYRLRKFTRRYRVQVAAAALVLLSLVLGLSGTLWFLVESQANEQTAVARAREAEGVRIAAEAALLAKDDPNLALLLALEASALTNDSAVRRSIYDALPQHCLVQRLDGHDHGIEQGSGTLLQYLSDGRLVGSGASDAVLWDPETGTQLRRFAGPRASIDRMVIDPAERLLLAAAQDGTAWLWELETGACLRVIADHEAEVTSCAFSPDGSRFATSSVDGTARVFATNGDRAPLVLRHGRPVGAIAFDPSGLLLATLAADCVTRIWDARTGRLVRECPGRSDEVAAELMRGSELSFVPSIERVVSACAGVIRVHTTAGELLAELAASCARRSGERLFVTANDRLCIVDLRTGAIERHDALRLHSVTPTPDGSRAIAIDHKNDVCLLDLASLQIVRHYLGPADTSWRPPIAFHPDGTRFAVQGGDIRIWSFEPEWMPFQIPDAAPASSANSPAWGPELIAVVRHRDAGPDGGPWHVWDVAKRRRLGEVRWPGLAFLEPSPCGTKLIGGLPEDGPTGWRLVVLDLDGRLVREIRLPPCPRVEPAVPNALHWAIDRAGKRLVTVLNPAGRAPTPREGVMLQCHDLDTGELLSQIPHPGGVPSWVGGPQSELVAMAGLHLRTIELVDRRTGEVHARVSRPPDGMHIDAAVSPDGRYLLGTLAEPLAFVWDLHTAVDDLSSAPLVTYTGLVPAGDYPCGFLAGGRLAWVVCNDEVHVFETVTGRVFAVLRLPDTGASVAESPDGTRFATQTNGGCVQRYPLDPIATARRLAVGRLDAKELAQYRIGSPTQRVAAERAWLVANASPGHHAQLGRLALADGDLDEAIACYQRGADLGVFGPYYEYLYRELLGLYCRRLAAPGRTSAQQDADRTGASAALEHAFACGTTRDAVLALPDIDRVRDLPRFATLVGN
ncbi:MAG TPA: protein kinase [Planctomycetota bacterium]|nr:protein kinase [Planctomycetota bacterium]